MRSGTERHRCAHPKAVRQGPNSLRPPPAPGCCGDVGQDIIEIWFRGGLRSFHQLARHIIIEGFFCKRYLPVAKMLDEGKPASKPPGRSSEVGRRRGERKVGVHLGFRLQSARAGRSARSTDSSGISSLRPSMIRRAGSLPSRTRRATCCGVIRRRTAVSLDVRYLGNIGPLKNQTDANATKNPYISDI